MNPRRWLLSIVAMGCVLAATATWQHTDHPAPGRGAARAQVSAPAELPFRPSWTRPVKEFRAAAFSPDTGFVGLVTGAAGQEKISLWHRGGKKPIWSHAVPGASQAAVSTGGRYVLAYAALDPMERTVTLLNGITGAPVAHNTLDGAIWDVDMSADGRSAGIVTGSHSLYLYTLDSRPRYHRWKLDGIGNSVAITPDSSYLAAGTWDESGVSCYTLQGAALWQYPGDPQKRPSFVNRLFEAQIAGEGRYILGLSYSNVRQGDGTLYLWRRDGDGSPLWTKDLGADAFYPKAQITPDGRFVAVTYLHVIRHGDQSVNVRHLVVLDQAGNQVWEKGGLLFSPILVALTPDGQSLRVIVSDGQKTLCSLNAEGRITAKYTLGGLIRQTAVSADGKFVLVYTGDGLLSLFKLR